MPVRKTNEVISCAYYVTSEKSWSGVEKADIN